MTGVTPSDFPEIPVSRLPDDAVLLDVREDDEWAAGHAPDAVHLSMTTLADRLDEVPEGDPIYVICRSGGRSARVTAYLNGNGWDAVNVDGGMGMWERLGKPLVSESNHPPQVI
ncbi:MAG: rhodanese-like domain-containing protein [Nakamurella sp.]